MIRLSFACVLALILSFTCATSYANRSRWSVAGLYSSADYGRVVLNFNLGWRFCLGDAPGAAGLDFDDASWKVVNLPHGLRLEPSNASGCKNYQGVAWYRKHFTLPSEMKDRKAVVYFEAIMGRQEIYVNGRKVLSHEGGYLPVSVDLSAAGVKPGETAVIAVMTDNSDDKTYPPGKRQMALDFAYHGGIYRDVYLLGLNSVYITDPNVAGKVAGGGVFVHYDNISDRQADVLTEVDLANVGPKPASAQVCVVISDRSGKVVARSKRSLKVAPSVSQSVSLKSTVKNPHLWSPDDPTLYDVAIEVSVGGKVVDGGVVRAGIRRAEFKGQDGFWLNGKPYRQLVGGNRHQDFAYVGNAMPNSQQWRDALRLKEAGMNIIRAAHYPQDPAFMDACDELWLFVIVPTPGWQYWNKDPEFAKKVHENTRQIIRRDRNHTSVLMWEPILNETRYPLDFAIEALKITREEFPFNGRPVAAADLNSAGVKENYDVLYDWPENIGKADIPTDKCIFTREFGEMVDDWYAHNCLNRAARSWGERPMLVAALSLSDTYGTMFHGRRQFIGGCQWHPFDHQRGYHPDSYLGGIYDAFRQKKTAFYAFRSQVPTSLSEPMVKIACEMTQFSDNDVVVFSNCDSVRLTVFEGDMVVTKAVAHSSDDNPSEPVVFTGAWDFWKAREYSYKQRNWQKVSFLAEGIVDGKVVCSEKKMPARRSTKLKLSADLMGRDLVADGSDFIVVVAEVTDDNGNVRRLAIDDVSFEVFGNGELISDERIMSNPRKVEWGSAPALIRSTTTPGRITVIAKAAFEGVYVPTSDTLVITSVAPDMPSCQLEEHSVGSSHRLGHTGSSTSNLPSEEDRNRTLREVEEQQKEFGVQK